MYDYIRIYAAIPCQVMFGEPSYILLLPFRTLRCPDPPLVGHRWDTDRYGCRAHWPPSSLPEESTEFMMPEQDWVDWLQ